MHSRAKIWILVLYYIVKVRGMATGNLNKGGADRVATQRGGRKRTPPYSYSVEMGVVVSPCGVRGSVACG